jgi:hypothetical protein
MAWPKGLCGWEVNNDYAVNDGEPGLLIRNIGETYYA